MFSNDSAGENRSGVQGAAVEHAMLTHPTPKRESPSRVGPPVAPKPKISVSGCESSAGVSSNKVRL